jgi:hypothetical protein
MTGKLHSLVVGRLYYQEMLGYCDIRGQFISLHDLKVNPYQRVATEKNQVRYTFTHNHKGMLANDCFAGEGPGIYSNSAKNSVCVNEVIIVNYEGSSSNYSSMISGSTFHH